VDELSGISVQRCVQSGDPALHITQYARQKKADLIMIPTHGYGSFRSLLLGSVTANVLHDAECPVWTTAHASEIATNAGAPLRHLPWMTIPAMFRWCAGRQSSLWDKEPISGWFTR